jgi:2-succinyl-5-enolpyruvyl-6-hydroxy-3-cyclohexene-1-carboxylate synthase
MRQKKAATLNELWPLLMAEEFVRLGVTRFFMAPGLRSSSLVMAFARHPEIRSSVHVDERALAFFAAGHAAAEMVPAVIVTTSGTAAANLLPAVIEASKKKVPLIILTADRPAELQKTGAHQTIEQNGLFRDYVRWSLDLPCPTDRITPSFVLTTVDQAVFASRGEIPGPVHLNCQFREPLLAGKKDYGRSYLAPLDFWSKGDEPMTRYVGAVRGPDASVIAQGVAAVRRLKNGVIAVGKIKPEDIRHVIAFSEMTGFPVWPDISSGLRLGGRHPHIIPYYDLALSADVFASRGSVDGLIHLGGRITSKRFYDFIASRRLKAYISVIDHPLRNDPLHRVTLRVHASAGAFCGQMVSALSPRAPSGILKACQKINRRIEQELVRADARAAVSPLAVVREVSRSIVPGQGVFLSNSQPVRDMDTYADAQGAYVKVYGNRGASGIDGILASAIGVSDGMRGPLTLLIGDLALLYDMNSLLLLKKACYPVVVIVFNNDGGGIFSQFPFPVERDVFEKFFAVPHGLSFEQAAALFGISYHAPADMGSFTAVYRSAVMGKTPVIIECRTSMARDHACRKQVSEELKKNLSRETIVF